MHGALGSSPRLLSSFKESLKNVFIDSEFADACQVTSKKSGHTSTVAHVATAPSHLGHVPVTVPLDERGPGPGAPGPPRLFREPERHGR